MKKFTLLPVLALVLCTLLASAAFAREITVMNACDFPLHGLNISAHGSSDDSNLLDEPLAPGEGLRINLEGGDSGWDFIVVDDDGAALAFENVDFTGMNVITIKGDGTIEYK